MHKEINEIKQLKLAGYLDTKDQDKIKRIICLYIQKMRQKTYIPADAGHFLRTDIDSTVFKNENLTSKIQRHKVEKPYIFKKHIPKDLETNETIKQNKYLKKYWTKK